MAATVSHVALPEPAFRRVLELLSATINLAAVLAVAGEPLDEVRAAKVQTAAREALAEAAVLAEQAFNCHLVLTAADAAPSVTH